MALSGDERDLYVQKWSDNLVHEMQQKRSRLEDVVTVEPGVMGEKTHFRKIGKSTDLTEHTSRFEPRIIETHTYEDRTVSPLYFEKTEGIEDLDLIRYSSNPQNDVMQSMLMAAARKRDAIIYNAIGATVAIQVAGSASTEAFPSGQIIAVDGGSTYASATVSGDTALHEGKLQLAREILTAAETDPEMEDVFVILPAKQCSRLIVRLMLTGQGRRDFVDKAPLLIPGLDKTLDGLLGLRFIRYEPVGVDASADQYVYVVAKSAMKRGVWKPQFSEINARVDLQGRPNALTVGFSENAVRMESLKVVRILCDPT